MNLFYKTNQLNIKELDWFEDLTASDFKVFISLVGNVISNNKVYVTTEIRNNIMKQCKISTQTFSNSINKLVSKEILTGEKGNYILNQQIILVE